MSSHAPADEGAREVTILLSPEIYEELQEIQGRRGGTLDEALRDALSSGVFLLKEAENGNRILIQGKHSGRTRELELA